MNKEKIIGIINNSSILNRLSEGRVCCFNDYQDLNVNKEDTFVSSGKLLLREGCDGYYRETLDKNDVIELSKVFSEIAKNM